MQTSIAKKSLLLLATVLICGSAWGEWVSLGKSSGGDESYIDFATIRKDGNLRKVWKLTNSKQRDTDGVMSRLTKTEIDCKQERYKTLALSTHTEQMAGGTTIKNLGEDPYGWSEIPPGSFIWAVMETVCAK